MNNTEKTNLQWHPAFYAGIQIELANEADKLIFENEHQLGTKPKQIDILIIKKHSDNPIQKNIGRIFLTHNIIEYKSPADYLSIDDFYLVYGYACLYKSDTNYVDEISADEITITFACHKYPRKLIKHLKKIRHYTIKNVEPGIYYIQGDFFPIQILWTKKLSKEENLWLHNLTDDISTKEDVQKLLFEYEKHITEKLYSSVMDVIMSANENKFEEVTNMCDALDRLYMKKHKVAFEKEKLEIAEETTIVVARNNAKKLFINGGTYDLVRASIDQLSDEELQAIYDEVMATTV